jgi:hypothetical protein
LGPQKERMDSAIFFPLLLVLTDGKKQKAVYYLPTDLQNREMFRERKPLSPNAKRAGWQGFVYDLTKVKQLMARLV